MSQNHLLEPTLAQIMDAHTDITHPRHQVEVKVDERGVLWVNIGPVCVLRICQMSGVKIEAGGTVQQIIYPPGLRA